MKPRNRALVALTVLLTATATLVIVNLASGDKKISASPTHRYSTADPQFLRGMGMLLGPALLHGNQVETLLNGDEIFPAMLAAIDSAEQTITFETYIYWSGDIGRQFADALSRRSQAGVKVHVLLDWVGSSKMEEKYAEEMRAAGVQIERYRPPRWYTLNRFNNRTHRKLLVVDGQVGFTGGVGIADKWSGNAQDADHWRDTHFRIAGPVVGQIQAAFTDNWTKVTGDVLHTSAYFPALAPAGDLYAQMFMSSIGGGAESMQLMYLLSIAAATGSIDLSMAYFVPDDVALAALVAAVERGVRLRILLPGPINDFEVVRRASRARWGALLAAGAEIHEYQPTMFHCKVLVVDRIWTSVGSTNFDSRSFQLNDEANLNVYDREFAERQVAIFEDDLRHARRVSLEEWQSRPWTEKLWEHTVALARAQL